MNNWIETGTKVSKINKETSHCTLNTSHQGIRNWTDSEAHQLNPSTHRS